MKTFVLDASVLIPYFFEPEGLAMDCLHDILARSWVLGDRTFISTTQLGEIFHHVARRVSIVKAHEAIKAIEKLRIESADFDRPRMIRAAELRLRTGLAFADSAAAGLALETGSVLVTSDRDFKKVEKLIKLRWV